MKQTEKIAVGIIAIICIAYFGGFLAQYGYPSPLLQQRGGTAQPVIITDADKDNWKLGIGRYHCYETVVDSLDIGTERTSATNYKAYWYSRRGSEWIYHATGDDKYVTLTQADGGYMWVVITIPTSQAFYVDYPKIIKNNDYIDSYLYTDVDEDGKKEFAFKYDMKGHPIPDSDYPAVTFQGFIITYDASFTGLNDLANETAIGTSTVTKFKSYYLAFAAATKGVAIYKVELKITTTDETKIRLDKLEIPGIGYLDGSAFSKSYTASDIRYTYTISNNFDGAIYLKHPNNANNEYDMTLGLECTLASSDDILVTLTVFYLVAQTEAGTSTNDTFYAQES